MEVDAFGFVMDLVLSEYKEDEILHPIAYWPYNIFTSENNYKIYDKEFLTIIDAFEEWK